MFVPDTGVNASFCRVQVTRSDDYGSGVSHERFPNLRTYGIARNSPEEAAVVCFVFSVPIECAADLSMTVNSRYLFECGYVLSKFHHHALV